MMRPFFVNLPLSYAAAEPRYIDLFIEHRLNPEFGIDATAIEALDSAWHRRTAARFTEAGLICGVHLPFHDLHPGSPDKLIREASLTRLRQGLDIAAIYAPRHMIGHAMYSERMYKGLYEKWLAASIETWSSALAHFPDHPLLCLENVYETAPDTLAALVSALEDPAVGVCFDIGHWHCFGHGAKNDDLESWLAVLAPHLRHLHLHDNDGSGDDHLGLGLGSIPFSRLFAALGAYGAQPGVTFEPHTEEALEASFRFMQENPTWFSSPSSPPSP